MLSKFANKDQKISKFKRIQDRKRKTESKKKDKETKLKQERAKMM